MIRNNIWLASLPSVELIKMNFKAEILTRNDSNNDDNSENYKIVSRAQKKILGILKY